MTRPSPKVLALLLTALSCLILYLWFAPASQAPDATPSEKTAASPVESAVESPMETVQDPDMPAPGERIGIRGHGILLRVKPGLESEALRESKPGESFYTTGAQAQADDLTWLEIELSPGEKAWISKGFIQRLPQEPQLEQVEQPEQVAQVDKASNSPATPRVEVIEDPHLKSAPFWPRLPERTRQEVSMKLAMALLAKTETAYSPDHAIALEDCLDASSQAPDLQSLKIYELASTCALALGWI